MRARQSGKLLGSILCAVTLISCASPETEVAGSGSPVPSDPSPATASSEPTPAGQEQMVLEVWFTRGDRLFPVHREVPGTKAVARASLETLLEGPSSQESEAGISSSIPEGTSLLDVHIDGSTAVVDLSAVYGSGGGSASMFSRLAQVVFTVTQFPGVDEVEFRMDGRDVDVFSGEGIVLDGPQSREDYEGQMPAIVVTEPRRHEEVGTTVTVTGTANVFEANVSITITGADGEVLAETFTTATCGTGCRGDYSIDIPVDVSSSTQATLKVYESSAEDGRPTNVVKVPITIVP